MSDSEVIPYDVLPTFETDNELLNRTLTQIEQFSRADGLPDYHTAVNENPPLYRPNNTMRNQEILHVRDNERLLLNNLDQLDRITSSVKIIIKVTKAFPQMGKSIERGNPLKEFHAGDIVTGCVTVHNPTSTRVPFEMFLVSLEGYVTIPSIMTNKVTKRTFLKMFDFGACYMDGFYPTANFPTPTQCTYDPFDETYYGFPESKVLEPGSKHKKFFYFRLPETLLENSCDHHIYEHFEKLPPSFGLDRESFNGRARQIAINESLGYGRLQDIGSPILLNDQSENGQSVSYAITVRMIGKYQDIYKNDPMKKFIMIKDEQYFFRFIPDESLDLPSYKDNQNLGRRSTREQLDRVSKAAKEEIERLTRIKFLQSAGIENEREVNELSSASEMLKKTNLNLSAEPIISHTTDRYQNSTTFPLYKKKLFGFPNAKSSEKPNQLRFEASISKNVRLGYIVPSVLSKISSTEIEQQQASVLSQVPLQSPVLSPVTSPHGGELAPVSSLTSLRLLNDETLNALVSKMESISFSNEVEIQLYCTLSHPPEIAYVRPALKSCTISSPSPIPVTFDPDFLLHAETPANAIIGVKDEFSNYLSELKSLARQTGRGIERQLCHDLISLSNIGLAQKSLPVFEEIILRSQPKWVKTSEGCSTKFKIQLKWDYATIRKLTLLPSFSICYFTKMYYLTLKLGFKKHSTNNAVLSVPIEVAKISFGKNLQ
ncbi:hypothetical protein KL905_000490 [Ogataea polymorpha]|nr:hypothetical protein KL905_000490 [Ogataea polymorpha]